MEIGDYKEDLARLLSDNEIIKNKIQRERNHILLTKKEIHELELELADNKNKIEHYQNLIKKLEGK